MTERDVQIQLHRAAPPRRTRALFVFLGACLFAAGCGADAASEPDPIAQPAEADAEAAEPDTETAPATDPLVVDTTLGPVRGEATDAGVNRWTAVPFAAPPLDDNRWRPPQPHPGWRDEFDATTDGLMCPQPLVTFGSLRLVSPNQDEDCLTLSVWSPSGADNLPTIVWIHPGGQLIGSAHEGLYESTDLAAEGVVVVGINYRLGTLGFLAHPDAPEDGANFGFMDQQAALGWVRDNIAAFGGDPDNVTLVGHSSGGFSVCAHLAAEASTGLFHKAIIQSGGGCGTYQGLGQAHAAAAAFVASTSCAGANSELECMRALPVEELARLDSPREIVGDGVVVDETALERAAAGELNDVPIMIGSTRDEYTLFTTEMAEPTENVLLETVRSRAFSAADEIMALYPAAEYDSNLARFEAIQNDLAYSCAAETFAETLTAAGGTAYRYYFSHVPEFDPDDLGATHGAELLLLFDTPAGVIGHSPELDTDDSQLSAEIQRSWTSFAANGAPDAPVRWQPTASSAPTIMQIDTEWSARTEIRDGRCSNVADVLMGYYSALAFNINAFDVGLPDTLIELPLPI
jgi:para-nitrobenzyl esterase